jgi:hypothetical protein
MVEREIAGIGKASPSALRALSQKSCSVLHVMGPGVRWQQSYVSDDVLYCIFIAPSEGTLREHARQANLPIVRIREISTVIDPVTSE